ncbi:lymphocyte antigen 6E-like [Lissotriton helveticus]
MKAVWGCLLAAVLLVGTGHALKCYLCSGSVTNANCKTSSTCPTGSASYCKSVYASGSGIANIYKTCESSCSPGSDSFLGVTTTTTCCSSDECNGANSVKISYTLLSLAAAISALVVRAVL